MIKKLSTELINYPLPMCNYIHCLALPKGVKAFITEGVTETFKKGSPLVDNAIIKRTIDGSFAKPTTLYLSTVGVSNDSLHMNLQTKGVGIPYLEIQQDIQIATDIANSLKYLNFAPDSSQTITILGDATHEIITTAIGAIRFQSIDDIEFDVTLNDEIDNYPMMEDIIYSYNLDKVIFHNKSSTQILTIKVWTMT